MRLLKPWSIASDRSLSTPARVRSDLKFAGRSEVFIKYDEIVSLRHV